MDYLALSHASKQCAALLACDLTARRAEFAVDLVFSHLASVFTALAFRALSSVCTTRQGLLNPAEVPQGCVRLDPSLVCVHEG